MPHPARPTGHWFSAHLVSFSLRSFHRFDGDGQCARSIPDNFRAFLVLLLLRFVGLALIQIALSRVGVRTRRASSGHHVHRFGRLLCEARRRSSPVKLYDDVRALRHAGAIDVCAL